MIWFACKNCGKTHSRPETSIGTMLFCDCGQGITVPWESTVAAPPIIDVPEVSVPVPSAPPLPGRYEPIPVGEEQVPPHPRPRAPEPLPPPERPMRSRRPGPRRRDPRFCFNHEDNPVHKTCADCGEPFCAECLLEFRGATLCAPCKNLRVRTLQQPPRLSGKAISSVLIGMLTWPISFCLILVGVRANAPGLMLLALLPNLAGLGLGLWALRDTEADPHVSGRALAITGLVTGAVASVLMFFVTIFPPSLPG